MPRRLAHAGAGRGRLRPAPERNGDVIDHHDGSPLSPVLRSRNADLNPSRLVSFAGEKDRRAPYVIDPRLELLAEPAGAFNELHAQALPFAFHREAHLLPYSHDYVDAARFSRGVQNPGERLALLV